MEALIDLHCHLLPGIDDGPRSMDESAILAAALARDGVATVAATPHLRADHPDVRPAELAERVTELRRELHGRGIEIEVAAGGELDMAWAHHASDEELRLVSYGQAGSTLLLETPYGPLPHVFEHVVGGLRERGFRILLGHPERSPSFQAEPERLERLVAEGVLVQITAMSLSGNRSGGSRRLARRLVERGCAHVLASDAHSAHGDERATLSEGVEELSRLSPELAAWMVQIAPAAILAGDPVGAPPVPRTRRRLRLR
jgi:protein-tyrosine phosphatase